MAEPSFTDETWISSTLRASVEAIAWVAGPWAAGEFIGLWAVPLALAVLLGIPWLVMRALPFSPEPPESGVSTPGLIRVAMFLDLGVVAVIAAWYLLGSTAGILTLLLVLGAHGAGWDRMRWMIAGAPPRG